MGIMQSGAALEGLSRILSLLSINLLMLLYQSVDILVCWNGRHGIITEDEEKQWLRSLFKKINLYAVRCFLKICVFSRNQWALEPQTGSQHTVCLESSFKLPVAQKCSRCLNTSGHVWQTDPHGDETRWWVRTGVEETSNMQRRWTGNVWQRPRSAKPSTPSPGRTFSGSCEGVVFEASLLGAVVRRSKLLVDGTTQDPAGPQRWRSHQEE